MKSSPFMKRVLIPFWLVQLAFVLCFFRVYIWLVTIIDKYENSGDDEGKYDNYGIPVVVYLLTVVCLIGLMLLLAEIFLFFCGKLKPINYFVVQSIQTFIWLGMLVAQVINGVEVISEDGAPDATRSIVLGDMRYVGISTALL
ncbi:hypothetical protein ABVK25_002605 [Lepraria finkii]|uniref:Uncharacterized protein n=1 Tax=Lepraria finkii TaxID=1340010 RepID=A0ABR4BJ68_9LECA